MPETSHYHDHPGHSVGAKDSCAGHPGSVKSCNVDLETGKYHCIHNEKKPCFITTAVFGSPMHHEVLFLQQLRDDVIRRTRWGERFFGGYFTIYNQVSPEIAARIELYPETKDVLRWSVIRPWLNYLRLMMARPREWRLEGVEPELRVFLERMREEMEAWLQEIPLPEEFEGLPPVEAAREVGLILHFVLRGHEEAYLERLTRAGALPFRLAEAEQKELQKFFDELGVAPEVAAALLSSKEPALS